MASTLDKHANDDVAQDDRLALVVDEKEFEEALHDPRVREFNERADALVRDLEAAGRNL